MRLIDADKLKQHYVWWNNEEQRTFDQIVDAQPTANAVPVVHGKWLWFEDCSNSGLYCSACHKLIHKVMTPKKKLSNYCHNCGAKMDGGAENG